MKVKAQQNNIPKLIGHNESTAKRTKRQHRDWKNIFTSPPSNRGLIYRIYEELNKLDNNQPNNLITKWSGELTEHSKQGNLKLPRSTLRYVPPP
jgi:hypothetical protein